MISDILFNQRPDIELAKMLDKSALTQRVISANVANVKTPGYQKRAVSFDEVLKDALRPGRTKLKTTDPRHLPDPDAILKLKPEVVLVDDGFWNGVNNVNIEEEMVNLGTNQLDFTVAARIMSIRSSQLRAAIRGTS